MLYQICNGKVAYADKVVLQNINFEIRNTEKIAVVGRNGCGKTTLLKLIMGELELDKRDSDEDVYITKAGAPVIGWLQQMTFDNDSVCLADEIRKVFAPILLMKARMEELLKAIEANATTELVDEYSSLEEQFTYLGGYRYEKDYEMVVQIWIYQGRRGT